MPLTPSLGVLKGRVMELVEYALKAVSETAQVDFKKSFDPGLTRDWVEIVKDIVAMANSGGGVIVFGLDNQGVPVDGFDADTVFQIDPADITNRVYKYTGYHFGEFELLKRKKENKEIVLLVVEGVETPMLFSKPGTYSIDGRTQKTGFSQGTIYFRHGAKSEPATREDLLQWQQRVKKAARNEILDRIKTLATLPEGADIQIVSSEAAIDTPKKLLESAVRRRKQDPNHMLTSRELLWIFQQRHQIEVSEDELLLLIGSGLRRTSTLYWWLQSAERQYGTDFVLSEVLKALDAGDRDKSDAARSIVEVASVYADENLLQEIISRLRESRYAHFRDAGKSFTDRKTVLQKLETRIAKAKHNGQLLLGMPLSDLEELSTEVSSKMFMRQMAPSNSRRLGDITRVIWYRNSDVAQNSL